METEEIEHINWSSSITAFDQSLLVELQNYPKLKILILRNNGLKRIPDDLSSLQNLEVLDLGQNEFEGLKNLLTGLQSLPKLKHLFIELTEADEDKLVDALPTLVSLNGIALGDMTDYEKEIIEDLQKETGLNQNKPPQNEEFHLEPYQDDNFEHLLKKVQKNVKKGYESVCTLSFNSDQAKDYVNFSSDVSQQVQKLLTMEKNPCIRNVEQINEQQLLLEKCFDEMIKFTSITQPKTAETVSTLKASLSSVGELYYSLSINIVRYFTTLLNKHSQDRDNSQETIRSLYTTIDSLERTNNESDGIKRKVIEECDRDKGKLLEEIGFLKAELEKLSSRLKQYEQQRKRISSHATTDTKKILKMCKSPNNNNNTSTSESSPMQPLNNTNNNNNNSLFHKNLTLKQMKEIIGEIYESKEKYDKKCVSNQLPRETMEQHIYTYLNMKFGLKSLIIEYANAILTGIKRYSGEDIEVKVFGKIVACEIDEEFRYVVKQLKDTVGELLKLHLKNKFRSKSDMEIMALYRDKTGSAGVLTEDEWTNIIKYMYNKEDSMNLIIKIKETIKREIEVTYNINQPGTPRTSATTVKEILNKSNSEISYLTFMRLLLDYQLKGHEKFLSLFVDMFRGYDADRDGVLNEMEFRGLVVAVNPNRVEEEIDDMLNEIDPYNYNQIPFSVCVSYLSNEIVQLMANNQQNQMKMKEKENMKENEDKIEEKKEEANNNNNQKPKIPPLQNLANLNSKFNE